MSKNVENKTHGYLFECFGTPVWHGVTFFDTYNIYAYLGNLLPQLGNLLPHIKSHSLYSLRVFFMAKLSTC